MALAKRREAGSTKRAHARSGSSRPMTRPSPPATAPAGSVTSGPCGGGAGALTLDAAGGSGMGWDKGWGRPAGRGGAAVAGERAVRVDDGALPGWREDPGAPSEAGGTLASGAVIAGAGWPGAGAVGTVRTTCAAGSAARAATCFTGDRSAVFVGVVVTAGVFGAAPVTEPTMVGAGATARACGVGAGGAA